MREVVGRNTRQPKDIKLRISDWQGDFCGRRVVRSRFGISVQALGSCRAGRQLTAGSYFWISEDPRRQEPAQRAGTGRWNRLDVDAADRALLELAAGDASRPAGGQLANARLVAHERDALRRECFSRSVITACTLPSGASESMITSGGRRVEGGGDDLGGLARADQRAGEHDVERRPQTRRGRARPFSGGRSLLR